MQEEFRIASKTQGSLKVNHKVHGWEFQVSAVLQAFDESE